MIVDGAVPRNMSGGVMEEVRRTPINLSTDSSPIKLSTN
jgi:hypothetical protein